MSAGILELSVRSSSLVRWALRLISRLSTSSRTSSRHWLRQNQLEELLSSSDS